MDKVEKIRVDFLKPEIRSGVEVSAELKAAWKVMLDILEVFIKVCDKYGLCYWLEGGSMLGAVRHKGFIPWDDDIDVAMPRKDFEKLQEVLPAELPPHLFMQTSKTDPQYASSIMKIRNSETTGITLAHVQYGFRFNMGLAIDVHAIDAWIEDGLKRRLIYRLSLFWKGVRRNLFGKRRGIAQTLRWCVAKFIYFIVGNKHVFDLREQPFRRLSEKPSKDFAIAPAHYGWDEKTFIAGEWIKEFLDVPFEYLTVKIPAGYEGRLKVIYGDWKTPRKGASYHGDMIIDVHRRYDDVLKERFGY